VAVPPAGFDAFSLAEQGEAGSGDRSWGRQQPERTQAFGKGGGRSFGQRALCLARAAVRRLGARFADPPGRFGTMVGLRGEAIYALVAQPCLQAGEQQGGILARPRVAEEVVTTGLGVDRLLGQQAQAGDLGAKRHRGKALARDQREPGFVLAGFA
jgi:hypothetical protein